MSTEAISPLRQRMIEDMNARKLGAHTIEEYRFTIISPDQGLRGMTSIRF